MDYIKLKGTNVLIIGDVILDSYFEGITDRISPEAPVPIVLIGNVHYSLGGAANVAQNIRSLGGVPFLIGTIGQDDNGRILEKILADNCIANYMIKISSPTITKIRVIANNQQIVRMDFEAKDIDFSNGVNDLLISKLASIIKQYSVVVISDYGKGGCHEQNCQNILQIAKQNGVKVIIDPKGRNWLKYKGAYMVTPNLRELSDVVGFSINNQNEAIVNYGTKIKKIFEIENLLVTRSERGMSLLNLEENIHLKAEAKEVFDVSGAGDTVVASISIALAAGYSVKEAILFSNRAASIVVGKRGTACVKIDELFSDYDFSKKIILRDNISKLLDSLKREGKKIVFTNGCFDVLHKGHVSYLHEASKKGDVLIVGLNSDTSVKRLKGSSRPINNQEDRAFMLATFDFVSYVVIFEEDTPFNILSVICPDVLVKGGDYRISEIIGREFSKETIVIPYMEGYSTSRIVDYLKKSDND